MLDYVMSGGHRDFLKLILKMYQDLMVNKEITAENMKQAHILGCSTEMVSLGNVDQNFLRIFKFEIRSIVLDKIWIL